MGSKIKDSSFYKAFFAMTITMALQNLIIFGVNLADSVMMGAYSETALSGVGIFNNIPFFITAPHIFTSNYNAVFLCIGKQYKSEPVFYRWISVIPSLKYSQIRDAFQTRNAGKP